MSDMNDLNARRDAMLGNTPSGSGDKQQERVYKMFTPSERIAVIKGAPGQITLGSGGETRQFTVRPMNPRQLLSAYGLLRAILIPLQVLFTPVDGKSQDFGLMQIAEALGENIDKIPALIHAILSRGNDVSLDWIEEHLDILLDLQLIIPVFIEQNGLGKLFGPNAQSSAAPTSAAAEPRAAQEPAKTELATAESPV
ncbi:MAG: hypothetical protein ACREQ5_07240 [Candidatus Dormibacteria bacterium]